MKNTIQKLLEKIHIPLGNFSTDYSTLSNFYNSQGYSATITRADDDTFYLAGKKLADCKFICYSEFILPTENRSGFMLAIADDGVRGLYIE